MARMLYVDPSAGSILLQVAFAAVVGGALTVVSQAGRGTRLLIELPLGPPRG